MAAVLDCAKAAGRDARFRPKGCCNDHRISLTCCQYRDKTRHDIVSSRRSLLWGCVSHVSRRFSEIAESYFAYWYRCYTVPWSVCLSVRHVRVLCLNARRYRHDFFCQSDPPLLCGWSYWLERRRHSTANFDRIVRYSAMVTMEHLQETTIALSNDTISLTPTTSPFLCK